MDYLFSTVLRLPCYLLFILERGATAWAPQKDGQRQARIRETRLRKVVKLMLTFTVAFSVSPIVPALLRSRILLEPLF